VVNRQINGNENSDRRKVVEGHKGSRKPDENATGIPKRCGGVDKKEGEEVRKR
jgi:hypothetical protein